MRLFIDTLRAFFSASIRFGVLLLVLFGVHLVATRALPELRKTAQLLEEEPRIQRELEELTKRLEQERRGTKTLEDRLAQVTKEQVELFKAGLATWEKRIEGLRVRKDALEKQLLDLERERAEYCDTYNPLKWWFCSEVESRTAGLRETLMPVVSEVTSGLREAETALVSTRAKLAALQQGDPRALGAEGAAMVALADQLAASRTRAKTLSDRIRDARERRAVLVKVVESPAGYLLRQWQAVWGKLAAIALLVLLLPYAQRTLWYFVVMPLAQRASPLRLSEPRAESSLTVSPAQRSLAVSLAPGADLSVRAGYARPVEGHATSRLFYRWAAPLVSYSAGLVLLTRLRVDRDGTSPVSVTLSSPSDPNSYLLRVELVNHPGVVLFPRQLVGIEGQLELRTVWRFLSFHAWATGQLRYVLLAGTGAIVLEGTGDIVATTIAESRAKIEQELVVGFDTRLGYCTARTETFLPYLLGRTALVDDVFEGSGTYFWQKSTTTQPRSFAERSFDAVFGAIGKLLGF